jgi:putative ABC transport system ATP-binding protein
LSDVLELQNVGFYYPGKARRCILQDASFSFGEGALYAITGPSGSGKTTTLSLLGALDAPTGGRVAFRGRDVREIGAANYRNRHVGFVFQSYNLLNYLTACQNVMAAMEITKNAIPDKKGRARALLRELQLDDSLHRMKPGALSGGEQQRVAIARALATEADVILADEPTGNLDPGTAREIIGVFRRIAHDSGKCVVVATHSERFAEQADYVVGVKDRCLRLLPGV